MHTDDVEVSFCDLCGTSVPVVDLQAGTAVRHQGKTVGACCLPALRVAPVATGVSDARTVQPVRATVNDARVLPVAIVLLAAIAAATIFLDHRVTTADSFARDSLAQVVDAQTSDSQVLASLAVAMDTVPRRTELDTLVGKVDGLATAAGGVPTALQQQLDALTRDVAALAADVRAQAAAGFDARPLLEDLRQRQVRLLDVLTAVRAVTAVPGEGPPAADTPPTVAAPAAPQLPPAIAAQVAKLASADAAVRFEAVDELVRSNEPLALGHLLPLARDADPFVRRLTVEGLAKFKRPEAVDALLAALADDSDLVRDTAWRSLRDLTGQKLGFDANGSRDARARAVQKWSDWWEKNKAGFGS